MKPKIKILHQYHNNMFDTVRALETEYEVEFLSYRVSQLVSGIQNRQPKVRRFIWLYYVPSRLAELLGRDTSILLLKHVNDPINFIPYLLAWLQGIQVVVFSQRLQHKQFIGYRTLWWLTSWLLRTMRVAIVATTQSSYQELKTRFKYIAYIPASINPAHWLITDSRRPKSNQFYILTVAKYQPRKNIPLVLAAVARLRQQYPQIDWQLTVAGDLTLRQESQGAFQQVQETIKEAGLEHQVQLLQNTPYSAMPKQYAASDVVVLVAASEPLGYAVVEAMAAGKPVICSDETGAASYIEPGSNGYICQTGSVEALVKAVTQFLTVDGRIDTAKIEHFGRHSQDLIKRNHSPEVFMNSFRALVLSAAGSTPSANGSSKLT